MIESSKAELLELYKLHVGLIDNVSQRRESVGRLHVSLLSGLGLFAGFFAEYSTIESMSHPIFLLIGILGIAISFSWQILINSYQQLNSGKFNALEELEEQLIYQFFKKEWEILKQGEDRSKYWKLTNAEKILPCTFGILFLGLTVSPICSFIHSLTVS